jgi:hypothetical protein
VDPASSASGPTHQAWIAQPSIARAASRIASEKAMWVDDPLELLIAALERHRPDHLGDHVADPVADYVGAHDLAGAGVDDEVDESVPVVVRDPGAHGGELLPPRGRASLACASLRPMLAPCGLGERRRDDSGRSDGCPRRRRARPRPRLPRWPCGRAPCRGPGWRARSLGIGLPVVVDLDLPVALTAIPARPARATRRRAHGHPAINR